MNSEIAPSFANAQFAKIEVPLLVEGEKPVIDLKPQDPALRNVLSQCIPSATATPTWTDSVTGLMWVKDSTSSEVTWNQASNYCSNLRLAGYSNWRLATIDELAGIYDQTPKENELVAALSDDCHVKGGVRIHSGACYSWSNSSGTAYYFGSDRGTVDNRSSYGALCVRRSGE